MGVFFSYLLARSVGAATPQELPRGVGGAGGATAATRLGLGLRLVPFAEAALAPDLRAFITPLVPVLRLINRLPWWAGRMILSAIACADPPLPGAPPPAETELSLLSDDGETKLAARIYEPLKLAGGKRSPLLFFVHGGGFVMGDVKQCAPLCRAFANELGWRVLAVTYRRAPEHRYPAAALDVLAAYTHVLAHCTEFRLDEASRIVVCGDSAGGQLTLELALRACDTPGMLPPVLLALIYPAINLFRSATYASFTAYGSGYGRDAAAIGHFYKAYCTLFLQRLEILASPGACFSPLTSTSLFSHSRRYLGERFAARLAFDAYLNPDLRADFAGVPPMVLLSCEFDMLGDEARNFVKVCNERGGNVEHILGEGHMHASFAFLAAVPSAQAIFRTFCAHVKARVGANF